MIRVSVKGLPAIQGILKNLPKETSKELREALIDEAQGVIGEAQKRVPVVTGQLRSSAYVRATKTRVDAGYDAPHAVYVHEIPYDGHTTKGLPGAERNGEGYKWLAKAAQKMLRGARQRLARRLKLATRRARK